MQSPASHKALAIQHSDTKIVELSGYVVIVVQSLDGKIKLFGSPADKDNLEVADEVLNVNERVLGDLPHAEVVRYLHECVRSCVIKLRVKRRSDARLCFELANSVQDAFVIAVEEKARQRLQRLLAQQRVKPVDMSQLSLQLNQAAAGNSRFTTVPQQDFSFLREGSPIYVTSLSGHNVTACSTKTTDSSVAFKPAASQQQQYTSTKQQQQQQKLNNSTTNGASKLPQLQLPANAPKSSGGPATTATTPTSSAFNNHKPLAVAGAQLSTSSTGSVGSKTVNNNHIVHGTQSTETGSTGGGNGSGAHPQTSFDSFFGNSAKSVAAPTSVVDQPASSGSASTAAAQVNGHSAPREQLTTLSEVDSDPATDSALDVPAAAAARTPSVQVPITTGGSEVLLGDQSLRQDIRQRRRSGSSIVVLDGDNAKAQLPNDEGEFISGPLRYSPLQQQQLYAASIGNMDVMSANNQQDNGPYQEMAVDVPDSFIARNKTPPRYPPPNQQQQQYQHQHQHHQQQQLNSSVRPVPPPRDHLRIEQDGRLVNRAPAPQVPERNHPQHGAGPAVPDANAANIEKYREQLRRRHEEQARVAQEHEFLRASLRESRKLQALQNNHRPATIGVENTAYVDDDDVSATEPPKASTPTFDDVQSAIVQLHYELNKSGLTGPANRIAMVQQLLASAEFENALALREQVLQRRRTRHHNPVSLGSQELAKECIDLLAESNSPHAIELGDILSSYEMEGLMFTHDAIANDTDSSFDPNPQRRRRPSDAAAKQPAPIPPPSVGHHQMAANMINNNGIVANAVVGDPSLHPKLPAVYHSGEISDPIRIIKIEKSTEPLGATIRNEGDAVIIGRIVRGGAAEKSGLLHENDEILEVNGFEMSGRNVNDVCGLIASLSGTLTFLIVPAAGSSAAAAAAAAAAAGSLPRVAGVLPVPVVASGREPAVLHVRAHFDYDPEDDRYIPCRELGISFQKGDVLHVISRDDSNWWQAYREGEEDQSLAGLIPSQSFQHQREAIRLAAAGEAGLTLGSRGGKSGVGMGAAGKGSTLLCMRKATKGRNKRAKTSSEVGYPLYATTTPDDPDPEEILTYEEVALYYPRESHKRPIVLIGPPNIGRHELRQRLIADSDRFAAAMPHTSRPRRENENDYHFITRVQFEADILSRKFVEHGEYERAYYGTSLEAIRTVVSSGKICVLNLHPQSLKLLRASDLKPYVVLVAPPSLEKLRQKKERNSEPVKDDDLKEIIATARDMEARWGHQFDMIIINNDTERAYHQLLAEINSLEREPQWVPASWVH